MTTVLTQPFDFVLIGGGLQNALLLLALAERRPDAHVVLIERDGELGGNHTWSWQAGDVPLEAAGMLENVADAAWSEYRVAFPGLERTIAAPYFSLTSARMADVVRARTRQCPHFDIRCGERAMEVMPGGVRLASGEFLAGRLVVDARGPDRDTSPECAYQKFVGLEISFAHSLGLDQPILMDARVPQRDGFRFVYVLPFDSDRALVEDTYFSDSPSLDVPLVTARISAYLESRGWTARRVERAEQGVLPLPLSAPSLHAERGLLVAGYRGGWFHPTTGYSFPVALRLAQWIAAREPEAVGTPSFAAFSSNVARQQRFCAWLNRLLFQACQPEDRWQILERFYRLPTTTIERFYSLEMSQLDRLRVVCGRPPRGVSLRRVMSQGAYA